VSRPSVTVRWPELFVGLTPGQQHAVVRNLARSQPVGVEPGRAEVDYMVQYVIGEIGEAEYLRRCSGASVHLRGAQAPDHADPDPVPSSVCTALIAPHSSPVTR
jgi:hypothetical protein